MKRGLLAVAVAVLAAILANPPSAGAAGVAVQINLAPLSRSYSPPPLGRRQGWLAVSNRDWVPYSLVVNGKGNLALYRADSGFGGVVIPSGTTVTLALEKDTYNLYGNNPERLQVRIREGRTTTLSLEPYGYAGNAGLIGVVNDGDRVRNGTLFDVYAPPPVIVTPAQPPIIIAPPPPPPIIVNRPPIIVRPPAYRPPPPPPYYRPGRPYPPPPPPRPGRPYPPPPPPKQDGWGFVFGFSK